MKITEHNVCDICGKKVTERTQTEILVVKKQFLLNCRSNDVLLLTLDLCDKCISKSTNVWVDHKGENPEFIHDKD